MLQECHSLREKAIVITQFTIQCDKASKAIRVTGKCYISKNAAHNMTFK